MDKTSTSSAKTKGVVNAKSMKSKDARKARKAEQYRLADCMRLVTEANARPAAELEKLCGDLLRYSLDDLQVEISCARVTHLAPELLSWAIDLTERNMKKLYENCAWGWDLRKKTEELSEEEALYAVARIAAAGPPVAFAHFRFDMDHGTPVLYCYELQVEERRRGRGVGARLLALLERLAAATRMRCVRLTALRHNPRAAHFFHTCGYTVDETSPDAWEAAHYEILSKHTDSTPAPPPPPPPHHTADTALPTLLETACTLSS